MWRTIQGRRSKDEAGSLAVSLSFVGRMKFKRPVSRRRRMFPGEEGFSGSRAVEEVTRTIFTGFSNGKRWWPWSQQSRVVQEAIWEWIDL